MNPSETLVAGEVWTAIFLSALGIIAIVRGIQLSRSEVPYFVEDYRGWSCPTLALPYGGVFMLSMSIGAFRAVLPSWVAGPVGLAFMASGIIFMLGMLVWFPWVLLPGWYRRARKAGVPRHDPHAMARFKRLTKAQQRTTTWPNLPEPPRDEACPPSVE